MFGWTCADRFLGAVEVRAVGARPSSGSGAASTLDLPDPLRPELAGICAGDGTFGRPRPEPGLVCRPCRRSVRFSKAAIRVAPHWWHFPSHNPGLRSLPLYPRYQPWRGPCTALPALSGGFHSLARCSVYALMPIPGRRRREGSHRPWPYWRTRARLDRGQTLCILKDICADNLPHKAEVQLVPGEPTPRRNQV